MDQIKKIKNDLPEFKYVKMQKFKVKDYEGATNACIEDENLIMYFIVKGPNPLINKMITGGFIGQDTKLILLHKDNYIHLPDDGYTSIEDKEWLLESLQN